jgi:hypothetical protein
MKIYVTTERPGVISHLGRSQHGKKINGYQFQAGKFLVINHPQDIDYFKAKAENLGLKILDKEPKDAHLIDCCATEEIIAFYFKNHKEATLAVEKRRKLAKAVADVEEVPVFPKKEPPKKVEPTKDDIEAAKLREGAE